MRYYGMWITLDEDTYFKEGYQAREEHQPFTSCPYLPSPFAPTQDVERDGEDFRAKADCRVSIPDLGCFVGGD